MNIKQTIKSNLTAIQRKSDARTAKYRQRLLGTLEQNLTKKGQTVEDNKGLIERYKNAKPQGLNIMQQAMKDAL